MGTLHHRLTDLLVTGGVHHTLRGDKRHQTALAHIGKGLHEEIIMNSIHGMLKRRIVTISKVGIKDTDFTKGDITGCKVETALVGLRNSLIAIHMDVFVRIKALKHQASE